MAGPNVGFATLSIIPSARGFQRKLQSEIGGALDGATKQLSSGRGTMDKLASAGGAIVSVMGKATKAVGGLGIVTAGLALKGGFSRAMAIEDAQAALKGLGHDTKSIEKIMDSALASVKGTAFGLGDATTIAATAVAAGIKPGQELTRTLTLTANSAALARTGLDEMGSILNKVWTAGRVQTEELNSLADRGIPIWTALADSYGVSATELRKMVSDGKVDAETFANVLEGTVGDAALSMGDTTRGAWNNMMAALGRAGESFLKGVWPLFKRGLSALTDALDLIAPKVEELGEKFSNWIRDVGPKVGEFASAVADVLAPALQRVADFVVNTLLPGLVNFGKWLINHRPILIGIGVAIGTFMVAALTAYTVAMLKAAAATLLGLAPWIAIGAAIAAVTAGVIYAYQNWDWFRNAVDTVARFLADTLWPILQNVAKFLAGAFVDAWDFVSSAAQWLWNNVLKPLWSWISGTAMPILSRLVSAYLTPLRAIFDAVSTAAGWLWNNVLKPLGRWLSGTFSGIVDGVTGAFEAFESIVSTIAGFGSTIFNGVKAAIETLISPLQSVVGWVGSAVDGIKSLLGIGGSTGTSLERAAQAAQSIAATTGRGGRKFHTGGIVPGARGSETLAILEAGEAVFTRSQQRVLGDMLRAPGGSGGSIDYQALGSAVAAALRAEPPVTLVSDVAAGLRRYERALR